MSVSTAFAASDDAAVSAVDEIAIDEDILSVEDSDALEAEVGDVQPIAASEVVTKDTFSNYFDENGTLLSNVTATELEFDGDFSGVNVSAIIIDKAVSFQGKNATFDGVSFIVKSDNVTIDGFKLIQNNDSLLIGIANVSNVEISNNDLTFSSVADENGYAVLAFNVDNLKLIGNTINYVGNTQGSSINNAVYVGNATNTEIRKNKFNLSLVSSYVPWAEIPAGSGNWVSAPVSEGIVIEDSQNVLVYSNDVTVTYNDVVGAYDTLYTLDVKNSTGVLIIENSIDTTGYGYAYGIIIDAQDFTIASNEISTISDYYANGIDIEGAVSGTNVLNNNTIAVLANTSAYGIYSGMAGKENYVQYFNNKVEGIAYNIFGMSLGDVESELFNNEINLAGNYTTGIAYRGSNLNVSGNKINLASSEVGNETIWEGFGVEAVCIKVIKGNATISDNIIVGQGKGISLSTNSTRATLENNFINIVGTDDKDACAIYAIDVPDMVVFNNTIDYQGTTNGTGMNNAIYLYNADGAQLLANTFTLTLVSAYVPWAEVPAGSGNWVSSPISEGIVVESSDEVNFAANLVNVTYSEVVGSYDTIYAVDFTDCGNATIYGNVIDAKGHTYIYGIIISGENFKVEANEITTESDNYYANGIDVEGPAFGVVQNNTILATGVESAYAIYSGMNGQNATVGYSDNTIAASAYLAFGMSLGGNTCIVYNNDISAFGNYTMGIASKVQGILASNNRIELLSNEVGNQSMWESFGVETNGIKVVDGRAILYNNTIKAEGRGINAVGGNVTAIENNITLIANEDVDAYAVYAKGANIFELQNNTIQYVGATSGTGINNALYVSEVPVAVISGNKFDLALISSYVPWEEVPAGSGNWVSSPVSEGIVLEKCDGVAFTDNEVNSMYYNVVGSYDTIYAVSIKDSDLAVVSDNEINALGHTYIYGLQMNGDDFIIANNTIKVASDNYYANGIDIEGPAMGVVGDNQIMVQGVESAYGIYSGMNGQNTTVAYAGNLIAGEAYNVFGMSLGDLESAVELNVITLVGNYTTGIAYRGVKLDARGNTISANGSNVGNLSIWEGFGVETIGIKVVMGISEIVDNIILTTSDYAIDARDTLAIVHDNYLRGAKYIGDESVANATIADVYNNTPSRAASVISITEVSGDFTVTGVLKDINGNLIPNDEITYSFNGTNGTVKTDENGTFVLANLSNGEINLVFDGETHFIGTNATITLKDIAPATPVKVESQFNITGGVITINGYAVDTKAGEEGIYFATELLDANGNPIKGAKIQFAVNDKIYNRTTKENGSFTPYKLNMVRAGRYTMAFYFAGNDNYTGAFASVCVDLDKKPITIKASNKAYKASQKTKKYTVTLSTKVCSSHDGKAHLRSGLKVTLTVNGKTFNGKTNSKGQVTFKITNLKNKAKYKAKISYEGDATYESASKTVTITAK